MNKLFRKTFFLCLTFFLFLFLFLFIKKNLEKIKARKGG